MSRIFGFELVEFLKSIILWLELPLNASLASYKSILKGPSTSTSQLLRISFFSLYFISSSKVYPDHIQIVFVLPNFSLNLFTRCFTPSTLFSSNGYPPRIERPLIYSGSIDLRILSIISSISFTPWLKSQAS